MISSLITAMRDAGLYPTAEEVADVIWLAYHVGTAPAAASKDERALTAHSRDPAPEPDVQPSTQGQERQDRQEREESTPAPPDSEPPQSGGLYTWPSGGGRTAVGTAGTPFRSPGARALPGALEIGRALRLLKRRVGSRTRRIFDEEATVNRVAEERIWSPVSRPAPTRWLEAALVIDEGTSMSVWRETVREFTRLLELQGAFRDVRTWRLDTDLRGEQFSLRAGASSLFRSPTELIDPSGRRIIIVVTDCVSPAWEGERLTRMLTEWGRHHPLAILQMLPQKLWAQTSLYSARMVHVRPTRPGQPNAQLLKESGRPGRKRLEGIPVPIFTLEPTPAATWARMVAGLSGTRAPAFLLPSIGGALPRPPQPTTAAEPAAPTASERLGMFRARASPAAFELARLMAAAPLTLPVMRLIQRVMLPESRQVHLAEVFLGGVLCRVSSGAEDAEEARYDFLPGLRELLLDSAHVPDSVAVVKVVSRYLEERVGQSLDFAAILADPEAAGDLALDEDNREFARIGAAVLRRLGGRYSAVADRLAAVPGVSPMPKPEPEMPDKGDRVAELIEEALRSEATSLDLSSMGLTEVPGRLLELGSLRDLNLSRNKLTELPASIGRLSELRVLDLSHNQITATPWSLVDLLQLEELHLTHNRLSRVPANIGHLRHLRHLCLNYNRLKRLPAKIGDLAELEQLELSGNRLSLLPEALGGLGRLRELRLDKNRLSSLPKSLLALRLLERLYLHDNEALGIPEELLGADPDAVYLGRRSPARPQQILDYYFKQRRELHPLNEAKVVLVGRGGAGKTSVVNRLVGDYFKPNEPMTHGLRVSDWQVPGGQGEPVRLHLWDFGGQDVYHSVNQFFFTKHSLYLLVLNSRGGVEDVDAEYWLRLIRSKAGEPPVIVVLSKSEEYPFDLDRSALQQRYPFICEFVVTDCATGLGMAQLRQSIAREVGRMEHMGVMLPRSWFAVKNRLAALKANHLTPDTFRKLCADSGVADAPSRDALADYLHDLGSIVWFRKDRALSEICVLNPAWLIDAVGSIIAWAARSKQHGLVRVGNLKEVLEPPRYPKRTHRFFLNLMSRFELCFNSPADPEGYLIPELLDAQSPPEISEFNHEECLNFRYQYEAMLPGLLPRFIARTISLSEGLPRWRTGVILESEGCRALVTAETQYKRVSINVKGRMEGRRPLLVIIRNEFDQIHKQFGDFQVQELVPVPGRPGATVSHDELLGYERLGQSEVVIATVGGDFIRVAVHDLLYGLEPDNEHRRDANKSRSIGEIKQNAPDTESVSETSYPFIRKLFGTGGMRGEAGQFPLDAATVRVVGRSLAERLAENLGRRPILILGRDTRESSEWIGRTFAEGAREAGAKVESAGVITAPGVAYLARALPADAGVVISASHSPFQDNGIQIFAPTGRKLDDATTRLIEADIYARNRIVPGMPLSDLAIDEDDVAEEERSAAELRTRYLNFLAEEVASGLNLGDLTLVLDCANGAASETAPALFARLGAKVVTINNKPDGRNINLDCGTLHVEGLSRRVIEEGANLGVAFDGDADRALFIDARGQLVDGDATLWVLARQMAERSELPGNQVVATVMSNIGLELALRSRGIELLRTDVGDKYVLEELLRTGAALGGEQSGHIIFPRLNLAGDGMITAIGLLRVMQETGRQLHELTEDFTRYSQVLVNVRVREKRPFDDVPQIREAARAVRAKLGDRGRLLLRYSGTEPLARVMIEGERQDVIETYAQDLGSVIRMTLGEAQFTDGPEESLGNKGQRKVPFATLSHAVGGALESDSNAGVTDVTHDHRQVMPGWIFVAIRGARVDSHKYIQEALQKGAVGIISELECPVGFRGGWIRVKDARRALALAAAEVHGHPSRELQLIGITGPRGKTSIAYILSAVLESAGAEIAVMNTLEYRIRDERSSAVLSTPEACDVQRFLRRAVEAGCSVAVIEISDLGLDLHRCEALSFYATVFTSFSHRNLGYHKTAEDYLAASRKLFERGSGEVPRVSIISVDDIPGTELAQRLEKNKVPVIRYGLGESAEVTASNVKQSLEGTSLRLITPKGQRDVKSPLIGLPQLHNILAAVACALEVGYSLDEISRALMTCTGAPGRLEIVPHQGEFTVVIDEAHTEDGLINTIEAVRPLAKNRIITVIGCGGDRDRTKRAPIGEVAARRSDLVILTSDNPRTEDPKSIVDEVEVGARRTSKPYLKIIERREAIHRAVAEAGSGDVVIIVGKDDQYYQNYQIVGRELRHFDDREVVLEAINMIRGTTSDQPNAPTPFPTFEFETVTLDASGQVKRRDKGKAHYFTEKISRKIRLEMVEIPGGTFHMGDPGSDDTDAMKEVVHKLKDWLWGPVHEVTIPKFYLSKFPITNAQWRQVLRLPQIKLPLEDNPKFPGDDVPVTYVRWVDAVEFCARLSVRTGRQYRLPTEAEWEYACRAGTTTPFAFGETITPEIVNFDQSYECELSRQGLTYGCASPVGHYGVANAFGLYDMHGNVWEWCQDSTHGNYVGAPTDGRAWEDDDEYTERVCRGGCWSSVLSECRSTARLFASEYECNRMGFRVALTSV